MLSVPQVYVALTPTEVVEFATLLVKFPPRIRPQTYRTLGRPRIRGTLRWRHSTEVVRARTAKLRRGFCRKREAPRLSASSRRLRRTEVVNDVSATRRRHAGRQTYDDPAAS
ncbi:hypothetical protein MRX96_058805 [Rhipicephalus microplus]